MAFGSGLATESQEKEVSFFDVKVWKILPFYIFFMRQNFTRMDLMSLLLNLNFMNFLTFVQSVK